MRLKGCINRQGIAWVSVGLLAGCSVFHRGDYYCYHDFVELLVKRSIIAALIGMVGSGIMILFVLPRKRQD